MLGFKPLPRSLNAAVTDAKAKRELVRIEAVRELRRYAEAQDSAVRTTAQLALEERLLHDEVAAVRGEAALALADAGVSEAVPSLVQAAADENQKVRQMVLVALGELATPDQVEAVQVVKQAFCSDIPELRYQALIGLSRLNQLDDAQLIRCLTDEDRELRYLAIRVGEERYAGLTLPHQMALRVAKALSDEDLGVQLAAAICILGQQPEAGGEGAANDSLEENYGGFEQAAVVRAEQLLAERLNSFRAKLPAEDEIAAIEWVGKRRIAAAEPGLERRAFGWFGGPAVWQARVALAQLGSSQARARLLKDLSAWSKDVRAHAVVAVGQVGIEEAVPLLSQLKKNNRVEKSLVDEALALIQQKQR